MRKVDKNLIEIKQDIKIGNTILEAGDKIKILESRVMDALLPELQSHPDVASAENTGHKSIIVTMTDGQMFKIVTPRDFKTLAKFDFVATIHNSGDDTGFEWGIDPRSEIGFRSIFDFISNIKDNKFKQGIMK